MAFFLNSINRSGFVERPLMYAETFKIGTCSFEEARLKYLELRNPSSVCDSFGSFRHRKTQLDSVYLDDATADVTFVCGPEDCEQPQNVPAHKLVLAMQSPVFRTMFFGSMPEKPIVRITDATGDSFKEFLEFFYKDEMNPTIENAAEVVYLLQKYEVNQLLDVYSTFLQRKLTVDQIGQGLELAIRFDLHKLQEYCGLQIVKAQKNSHDSDLFVSCSRNGLRIILQLEELKFYAREMFFGCFEWTRNALKQQSGTKNEPSLPQIREEMSEFYAMIEFGIMDCKTIITLLYEYNDFFNQKDSTTFHRILAINYPEKLDEFNKLNELHYELVAEPTSETQYITGGDDEVLTFESNKKVYFTGYKYAIILQNVWVPSYNLWLTITRKSPNPDREDDIVLIRETLTTQSAFQARSGDSNERAPIMEKITIEPYVKYEVRVKPASCIAEKFFTEFNYKGFDKEPTDRNIVSVTGSSTVISSLQFKYFEDDS